MNLTEKVVELVLSLDQVGLADWDDWKIQKAIAPAAISKKDVHRPVSRRPRHAAPLACVSASGNALSPLIMTAPSIKFSDGHDLKLV
jgi:hypothetical protein